MYNKDVVCLSLGPGACWDVAEDDDGAVIWSWASADDDSEYTSLRVEPKVPFINMDPRDFVLTCVFRNVIAC